MQARLRFLLGDESTCEKTVRTYYVRMANITLSIHDDLLRRGRDYARARGTSLNALVRDLLSQTVHVPDDSVDAMVDRLRNSSGDSKGMKFTREELHRY